MSLPPRGRLVSVLVRSQEEGYELVHNVLWNSSEYTASELEDNSAVDMPAHLAGLQWWTVSGVRLLSVSYWCNIINPTGGKEREV